MPIFEYQCRECGETFEVVVLSQEDEREISCPHCGKARPERRLSGFATCASPGGGARACTPFR
jgi:putative FmdB family regulatory protein